MCDTVTVLLGDIVLLAFEKILDFYNCTNFYLQLHKIFYNCTICAQLHTKKTLADTTSCLKSKMAASYAEVVISPKL